jgi:transmembrane sensor
MTPKNDLAKWMTPDTSEVRVNRLWGRVQDSQGNRRPWLVPALGGALLAAAAVIIGLVATSRTLVVGNELASSGAPSVGHFSDGSQVELAQASAVRLVTDQKNEVRVELERGEATFEVSRRPSRKFVVAAGDVEVKVVGTRFTVTHGAAGVDVSVERGIVEVTLNGKTARLTAGQKWSEGDQADQGDDAEEAVADLPAVPTIPDSVASAAIPSAEKPARVRKHHASKKTTQPKQLAAPSEPQVVPQVPVIPAAGGIVAEKPVAAPAPGPTAAELFNDALSARREGRASDAALAYERLLRDFPHDSHSATAAFELGRVRMDQLNDSRGAALALEQALKLAPDGTFVEEALSRLVRAYDAGGSKSTCLHYRDQYLARFPNGPYASSVAARCAQ